MGIYDHLGLVTTIPQRQELGAPVQPANGSLSKSPTNGLPSVSPGLVQIPVSMYQTVVTSLAQGNGPVQVAMAPVTTRISDSAVTMDGQAVEVVTLE
ncbi:hypothetical protein P7K49_025631, partial [Saguinus oedipus]